MKRSSLLGKTHQCERYFIQASKPLKTTDFPNLKFWANLFGPMKKFGSKSFGLFDLFSFSQFKDKKIILGSGCGSIGGAVTFDTRGPWFESSHWRFLK